MKKIGIVGWNLGDNSFGATKAYLDYLSHFGDIVIVGPNTFLPELNLLVLPGGKDIVASNEKISFYNGAPDQFLEHFDKMTLPKYFDANIPIFGICRGMQTLMRHTGVPLVQDIWWDHGYSKDESDVKVNKLQFMPNNEELRLVCNATVGSWHHQCVLLEDVNDSKQWDVIAVTKDTLRKGKEMNVVEYAKHKTKPIYVVQSHPERNGNYIDNKIIERLLSM